MRNALKISFVKPEGNRPLGRPRHRLTPYSMVQDII
jgi:hypothetical protein